MAEGAGEGMAARDGSVDTMQRTIKKSAAIARVIMLPYRRRSAILRIEIDGVASAFARLPASMGMQVPYEVATLHAAVMASDSRMTAGPLIDSSARARFVSTISRTASRRFSRASSSVAPWVFAPGSSSLKPMKPSATGWKTAVDSSCMVLAGFAENPYRLLWAASDDRRASGPVYSTSNVEYDKSGGAEMTERPAATARKKRASRLGPWKGANRPVELRPGAEQAFPTLPKLARLVTALGLNTTADMLNVDRSQLNRCLKGTEAVGSELARRVSDLEYILDRAIRAMHAGQIGPWLTSPEPLLAERIPLNVLAREGPGPIIEALEGIYAGVLV